MGVICKVSNKNDKKRKPNGGTISEEGSSKFVPISSYDSVDRVGNNLKKNGLSFEESNVIMKDIENDNNSNFESTEKEIKQDKINNNFSNLDEYKNKNLIQDTFFENAEGRDDFVYNELKKLEKQQLKAEFENNFENHLKKIRGNLNLIVNNGLIQNIIENQDAKYIFKNKIFENINSIKYNKDGQGKKYDINYLTILLVGRMGVGKTTLIKYILNLKDEDIKRLQNNAGNNDFVTYKSKNVTYLKLIEYRGIGYGNGSDPNTIGHNTVKFINNHINKINKNKGDSYNDFVHCIWYCITNSRFEESENVVLRKLKSSYKDNTLPIVLVYTQAIDKNMADKMGNYIDEIGERIEFVKVCAKEVRLANNAGRLPSFGKEELLTITLRKCTEALGGNMINIMIKKISNDIKGIMLDINSHNEKDLNNLIINQFTNKYNEVLKDEQFMNYIINMIGRNLEKLFYGKKIFNSSLNLLIQSDIIINIKNFITFYKTKTKEFINTKINSFPEIFIDLQAKKEKEIRRDINVENKRNINGFKRTTEVFLKKNFYYISQRYIIDFIIRNLCPQYINEFRKRLDDIVKELLNYENNSDIKRELNLCFKMKLKNFAEKNNIDANINLEQNEIIENDLPNKNELNGEILKTEVQNTNSFDLGYNYNETKEEPQNNESIGNNILENWFPLNNNLKYLDNKLIEILNNNLQTKDCIDNYFKLSNYDKVFNSLIEYIKNDLDNFFNLEKSNFINEIHSEYTKKKLEHKLPIKSILNKEQITNIYSSKIKNEIQRLKQDDAFSNINKITTIVVGKSGMGKSTLINNLLELEGDQMAKEGVGNIVTKSDGIYENDNIPFLRIIDTRGIELDKKYGPDQILKNTLEIIAKQINNQDHDNENKYNNYVQCIWYCVNGTSLDPKEIEVIKGLLQRKSNIPLIIVYTNAKDDDKIEEMKKLIKKEFSNIPVIPVLARTIEHVLKSFGKEDLLRQTIKSCKTSLKTDVFKEIMNKTTDVITENFEDINNKIKYIGNKNMAEQFIKTFNDYLDNKEFLDYIFSLLENIIVEYLRTDNNEKKKLNSISKEELYKSTSFTSFIDNYNKFYREKTKKIIDNIKYKKAIKYLDVQANKEIREFKKNISNENKCDKQNFIQNIQIYLNSKFYYLSQKYILYRLITDISGSFSEDIEKEVNRIIKDTLKNNDVLKWCQDLYLYKLEEVQSQIEEFIRKGGYKNHENGGNFETKDIKNTKNGMLMENEDNLDCPNVSYPNFN